MSFTIEQYNQLKAKVKGNKQDLKPKKKYRSGKQIIYGNVPSKSNGYRIGKNGLFKSPQVKFYEENFYIQCNERNRSVQGEFEFHMDVYYNSKRPDLDGSLKIVLDCLQKARVIKNDNRCMLLNIRKFLDKINPRIEYEIREGNWTEKYQE